MGIICAPYFFINRWAGELRELDVQLKKPKILPLDVRKIIGRRAAMELNRDDIVNLGIGMPESVAAIAKEESVATCVTLTTEVLESTLFFLLLSFD